MIETVDDPTEADVPSSDREWMKIKKCPQCLRGIPAAVFNIHFSTCRKPNQQSNEIVAPFDAITESVEKDNQETATTGQNEISPDNTFATVPKFSLSERLVMLNKFEVLLLTSEQIQEFNKFFKERKLHLEEPVYQSWLHLKIASVPSEAEAIQQVLSKHTASNVPKRKTKRIAQLPDGPARYDPSSPEWKKILEEQENKKEKGKKRKAPDIVDDNLPKKKQPKKVPTKQSQKVPAKQSLEVPAKQPKKVPAKQPLEVPDKQPQKVPAKQLQVDPAKQHQKVPAKQPKKIPDKRNTKQSRNTKDFIL